MAKLNSEEIQKALPSIALWSFSDERGGLIRQTFTFPDFKKAFEFMSKMADFSESIDHHPEWLMSIAVLRSRSPPMIQVGCQKRISTGHERPIG